MRDGQARELAVQYIKDQLESIGNDYMDVSEFLDEDIDLEFDGTETEAVAKEIRHLTEQLTLSLETAGGR